MKKERDKKLTAAAIVVSSAFVSYAGATSTMSAPTSCRPSRPLIIARSSRVDHPPVSGVPVAGANAGSNESTIPSQFIFLLRGGGGEGRYILSMER